ncbi:DUF202 domain-containing protein [Plantactinospora sp. KLBMP9567]|uniref:DUF202 domain-containing protein n=1 Tax=Plantactinospora sp. KLBMP9567 TaxID=3085900 RepID=UPI00298158AD|nr:DUF202 domain-containing protein [Plantactinospora sp. KLBMP9567]MDW5329009.1 DUF202 domain-containing protein [Plantactinospora sp. KLBMP9567]
MSPERVGPEHRGPGRDVGLAAERTRLAWRRTVLAVGVVAVLTARLAVSNGMVGALVVLAGLGWLGVLAVTFPRSTGRRGHPGRGLPLIALITVGFAGLGLLLVLASVH